MQASGTQIEERIIHGKTGFMSSTNTTANFHKCRPLPHRQRRGSFTAKQASCHPPMQQVIFRNLGPWHPDRGEVHLCQKEINVTHQYKRNFQQVRPLAPRQRIASFTAKSVWFHSPMEQTIFSKLGPWHPDRGEVPSRQNRLHVIHQWNR